MAIRYLAVVLALLLSAPRTVLSLQVSPNSPCASVCLDGPDLDQSDPNSSNTFPSDIICKDAEYARTSVGAKWQSCLTCLQKSSFSQGSESDQGWFLYNLRYNFNYCIFGYPNNTKIGSNPCQTSTACSPLSKALQEDRMSSKGAAEYGYCNADGGSMTGQFYAKCLACVSVFSDQVYVTNGLVALEAGCQQRPGPGKLLGLSDSVFSPKRIEILNVSGSMTTGASQAASSNMSTPTTTIVIIVISALIFLAAVSAVTFVCVRKRRNRIRRAGGASVRLGHRPKSSLSFWCRTHPDPLSPKFFPGAPGGDEDESTSSSLTEQTEKRHHIVSSAAGPSLWRPNNAISSMSPVAEYASYHQHRQQQQQQQQQQVSASEKHQLHQLTTSLPAFPPNVHPSSSPATVSTARMASPLSAGTPTSATQLLAPGSSSPCNNRWPIAPYVPSDWAGQPRSGTSPVPSSPKQQWGWAVGSSSPVAPPMENARMSFGGAVKKGFRESGSPVETKEIQTSFPAPPTR